jgi:hypothetical protein
VIQDGPNVSGDLVLGLITAAQFVSVHPQGHGELVQDLTFVSTFSAFVVPGSRRQGDADADNDEGQLAERASPTMRFDDLGNLHALSESSGSMRLLGRPGWHSSAAV